MSGNNTLEKQFEAIAFFDKCRWNKKYNSYGTINYAPKDLTADQKLLTHWLCYITDRQMSFEQIWDVGGFVFSDMVRAYSGEGIKVLEIDGENSFFIENKKKKNKLIENKELEGKDNKNNEELDYCFQSRTKAGNNKILQDYDFKADGQVTFASRFYPSDYVAMLYTMSTLENYGKSLTQYIAAIIDIVKEKSSYTIQDIIHGVVYGLFLLSYNDIGSPTKDKLEGICSDLFEGKAERKELPENPQDFINEADKFFNDKKPYKNKRYGNKRLWCCIRDYIKSQEFGECFKAALKEQGVDGTIISMLFSDEAKQCLDLPGDVWNNNSKFRKCIIDNCYLNEAEKKEKRFNKLLRMLYDRGATSVYPEQFDVTFNFVPRMCEQNRCDVCPIGALKNEDNKNGFQKVCVKDTSKYCTIALMCGGYKCDCAGESCELLKLLDV